MGTVAESDIYGWRSQNFTAWQTAESVIYAVESEICGCVAGSGVKNLQIAESGVDGCVAGSGVGNLRRAGSEIYERHVNLI